MQNQVESSFFEDVTEGASSVTGSFQLTADEVVAFAERWDPLPMHLGAEGARAMGLETLSAPAALTFAIKQRLLHELPIMRSVIAAVGYEAVRFPAPLYAGRTVRLHVDTVAKRPSRSKPDRGLVTLRLRLITERDETVLDYLDTILVRRRTRALERALP